MNITNVTLVNKLVSLYLPRILIQSDYMFRQLKPLLEERVFVSASDIQDSFTLEINEDFINACLADFIV